MKPLYIFDLDGTLALIEHRQHFVAAKPKNWKAFYAASVDDSPARPAITTLRCLISGGADAWIWSGRSDEVARETRAWLATHVGHASTLKMRRANDYRADTVVKQEWLMAMKPVDRERLVAVFDDRSSVVAMWRDNGVACFQVAPGDF